jgi:prolyl-tRNA editing enzyme YbaK/EbsC (Cys-tRNA(Pro) deacylase)
MSAADERAANGAPFAGARLRIAGAARMSAAVERVVAAARAKGVEIEPREFPEGTRTAEDAARAVGCDVAAIVKSLVFVAGDEPVVAFVSGRHKLDAAKLARVAGTATARRASADEAKAATGFSIGGTAPFGYPAPLRQFFDATLLEHAEVWCAAGTASSVFPIDPNVLLAATGAQAGDLHEEPARPV